MLIIILFMVTFVYAYMLSINHEKSRGLLLIVSILTLISLSISIAIHDTTYLDTKPVIHRYDIEPVDVNFDDTDGKCIVEKINKNGTKSYFLNVYDENLGYYVLSEIENATYYRGFSYHMTKEEKIHEYNFWLCFPWECNNVMKETNKIYINDDTVVSKYVNK